MDRMPHTHSPAAAGRRRLEIVFAITVAVFVLELWGGLASNSLALLADAGHMFTDVAGIGLALARDLVRGPAGDDGPDLRLPAARDPRRRRECRAAVRDRRVRPDPRRGSGCPSRPTIASGPDARDRGRRRGRQRRSIWLLRDAQHHSLNMRGAYLEVMGDLAGSIAVIVAAVVIAFTGWTPGGCRRVDRSSPSSSCRAPTRLLREAVDVLLEATPKGIDLGDVRAHILAVAGVADVHDLHAWTITSGMDVLSAHVAGSRARIRRRSSTSCAAACPATSTSSTRPSSSRRPTVAGSRRPRTPEACGTMPR